MTDDLKPANTNLSFSQIMGGKQRKLTEDALGPTIYLLEKAGVSNSMIADVLFYYLKSFIRPPEGATAADATIWYAQLQRFRDELDAQIKAIETALDNPHD